MATRQSSPDPSLDALLTSVFHTCGNAALLVFLATRHVCAVNAAACELFACEEQDLVNKVSPVEIPENGYSVQQLNPDLPAMEVRTITGEWEQQAVALLVLQPVPDGRSTLGLYTSEAQLRQAQKVEAIGRLASGVAHDFNNILAVIMGQAQLLEMGIEEDNPLRLKVREIIRAGKRGAALTRHLLSFSRHQASRAKIINLNLLLAELNKMLARLIGEHIDLQLKPNAADPMIHADPNQIEQLFMNLVVNARDVMPRGGEICLETQNVSFDSSFSYDGDHVEPGDYVMVAVRDTGPGIPQDRQADIFKPFFTTKKDGTGLGLYTVRNIANENNGYVRVQSEETKGTTFRIYLPLAQGPAGAESTIISLFPEEGKKKSETILVVEDDENLLHIIQEILTYKGYQVLVAKNSELALELLRQSENKVDLLLSDVIMPQMNGPSLARAALELYPELTVLYMSGYPDAAVIEHGVTSPETQLIQKPFTPVVLLARIAKALASKTALKDRE